MLRRKLFSYLFVSSWIRRKVKTMGFKEKYLIKSVRDFIYFNFSNLLVCVLITLYKLSIFHVIFFFNLKYIIRLFGANYQATQININ